MPANASRFRTLLAAFFLAAGILQPAAAAPPAVRAPAAVPEALEQAPAGAQSAAEAAKSALPVLDYFALGDSIASGHGQMDGGGACRQSAKAYPHKLAQLLAAQYSVNFPADHFLACSGATAQETKEAAQAGKRYKWLHNQVADALTRIKDDRLTVVSISIGANDLGWLDPANVALRVAQPTDAYLAWVNQTAGAVARALFQEVGLLLEKHPQTVVVINELYNPINKASWLFGGPAGKVCQDPTLTMSCYEKTKYAIAGLNNALTLQVWVPLGRPARLKIVPGINAAFDGHEGPNPTCGTAAVKASWVQYPSDPRSNSLPLVPAWLSSLTGVKKWLGDCFHPNEQGAAAIAQAVKVAVDSALAGMPAAQGRGPAAGEIAFTRGGEIWLADLLTGATRQLTKDGQGQAPNAGGPSPAPAWAPNGQSLAYVSRRDGNAEIYLLRLASPEAERVTKTAGEESLPAFSPDGKQLWFVRQDSGEPGYSIIARDLASGRETVVYQTPEMDPCYAQSLSVRSSKEFAVSELCGTGAGNSTAVVLGRLAAGRAVIATLADPYVAKFTSGPCAGQAHPVLAALWAPGSEASAGQAAVPFAGRMAIVDSSECFNPISGETAGAISVLKLLDLSAKPVRALDLASQKTIRSPGWSPDEKWLVYDDGAELWAAASGGEGAARLGIPGQAPAWRPGKSAASAPGVPGMITIQPPLKYKDHLYTVAYRSSSGYAETGPGLFYGATSDSLAKKGIAEFRVLRDGTQVTDAEELETVFTLYASAYQAYRAAGSLELGGVPPGFAGDLAGVTANPLFKAVQIPALFKTPQSQVEEALRGMITDQGAQGELASRLDEALQAGPDSLAHLLSGLSAALEHESASLLVRKSGADLAKALGGQADWMEGQALNTKLVALAARLLWLTNMQAERADWLATYSQAFTELPGSVSAEQGQAVAAVRAEAQNAWTQRIAIVQEFGRDEVVSSLLKAGGGALREEAARQLAPRIGALAAKYGAPVTRQAVAGALSAVSIGITLGNWLYGIDDLFGSFMTAQRANELRQSFYEGRLVTQLKARLQEGRFYDGELAGRYRAAYMLESLAAAQAQRSYADGVAATYRLPNPLNLLNWLRGQDWKQYVEQMRQAATQVETTAENDVGHPLFVASAVALAQGKPAQEFQPAAAARVDGDRIYLGDRLLLDAKAPDIQAFGILTLQYSPTREHFLVVLMDFEGDDRAFLFRADGSDHRQVTGVQGEWDYMNNGEFTWDPDGRSFVYVRINSCCADVPPAAPPPGRVRYDIASGTKTLLSAQAPASPQAPTSPQTQTLPQGADSPQAPAYTRKLYLTKPYLHGDDVLAVQNRLMELGYRGIMQPDGNFGERTESAVKGFQSANKLTVDGLVGPATWPALFGAAARGPSGPCYKVTGVAANDTLSVREGPSADRAKAGAIPANGSGIAAIGSAIKLNGSTWLPVSYKGLAGWVNQRYLATAPGVCQP